MPVLVESKNMALTYFNYPSDIVRRLMNDYWPGALTIIASCKKKFVYSPIRGGGTTVGLRMPDNQVILEILRRVRVPILGPSANFHSEPTPYSLKDVNPKLVAMADYIVDGICTVKRASTVVDCSVAPYKIIRQGSVILT
jgi:L-threonylcarbamoyladenylate synthase